MSGVTGSAKGSAKGGGALENGENAGSSLEAALDQMSEAFVLYDPDDRLVFCNARYREFYAASAPAIVEGATFEDIIRYGCLNGQYDVNPEDSEAVEAWVAERMERHRDPGPPIIQQVRGGRWLRIEETRTEDGSSVGFRVDVTEMVERERQLHEAHRIAGLGDFVWDAGERRFERISDTAALILGRDKESLLTDDLSFLEFVYPEDRDIVRTLDRAAATRDGYEISYRIQMSRGDPRHITERGTPVYDPDGKLLRVDGTFQDVTQNLRREAELQELLDGYRVAQDRLERAQRNASIGDYAWDETEMRFTYMSSQVLAIMGFEETNAPTTLAQHMDIVHPEDRERVNQLILETSANPRPYEDEYQIIRGDGEVRHIHERSAPIFGKKGEVIGYEGTMQDITDRKLAELELQRVIVEQSEAQERLEEQSAALVEMAEDIAIARDDAEAATRAKSEFLAAMSHEIRTPMNGVLGMTGLLLETDLSAEQRRLTEIAQRSATDLLAIINDILDFSKLEAGRIEIDESAFSINEIVDSIVGLMNPQANAKGVELRAVVGEDVPEHVIGDSTRLRQVLFNLVGNAVKFTEEGHVEIRLNADFPREGGVILKGEVEDSGIGIPLEAQSKLFESFTQADSTTARRFGGTGLGLAISKQLTEMMGGEIGLQSMPGDGSTFWFTVRCGLTDGEFEGGADHGMAGPAARADEVRSLKILVAEDNPVNQMVVSAMLSKLGHAYDVVGNGAEAIKALRGDVDYDLVLMDVQMPEMDGPTATQWIRASGEATADIPIIALTANALEGHRERYLAAGMSDYVAKPIDMNELTAAIARQCGGPAPMVTDTGIPEEDEEPELTDAQHDALASLLGSIADLNKD